MSRDTLIRFADALEDLMCEVGRGETARDRKLWALCRPLWVEVQIILKGLTKHEP